MSGIGYSTLFINGKQVDPSRANDPGWTTYERRTLYVNLAVDELVQAGSNAVGVAIGSGWYSQEQYIQGQEEDAYGPPRLWFWLCATYSDNSTVDVYSDESWMGATGSTVHDGVYMGSIQDMRWQRDGWKHRRPRRPADTVDQRQLAAVAHRCGRRFLAADPRPHPLPAR